MFIDTKTVCFTGGKDSSIVHPVFFGQYKIVGLIGWEKQGTQRTGEEGITCKVKTLDERKILK